MSRSDLQDLLTRATAQHRGESSVPRTLLVFAHPDDEVVGLGARLRGLTSAHLVHVTDGAPRNEQDSRAHGFTSRNEYRAARQLELDRALRAADAGTMSRDCLGVVDQEASLCLVELTWKVRWLLQQYEPEVVFTHPYEGGHPDHDACAFAVHHATKHMRNGAATRPVIVEPAFYHLGPDGIATGSFLPVESGAFEVFYRLTPDEQRRKRDVLACFATQQKTLKYFPLQHEVFRVAPEYSFTRPPQQGHVFYEQFPWGMTSRRFCELVQAAQQKLKQEMELACQ